MALFKIFKGNSNKLGTAPAEGQQDTRYAHEGFAYFTPDDGKFYIDIAGSAGDTNTTAISTYGASGRNRIPISAEKADRDNSGNIITETYATDIDIDSTDNKIKLYNKTGSAIANAELNILEVSTMNLSDILPPQNNTTNGQFLQSNGTSANWATVITTDELVKQTAKDNNVNYKLLATASASPTSGNAAETIYDTNVTLNPSSSTITASHFIGDLTGNADSASSVAWSNVTNKPDSYYTLPTAADNTLGGIKTNYSASGKNYAIKVDNNGNAYVNVPWTNNDIILNLNGQSTQSPSFYAPTTGGTADTQALVSNGVNSAPKWVNISPSISITAGTSSAAPKINTTVLGQSGTAVSITTATTGVYGVTKLTDTYTSTDATLAATGKSIAAAINGLDVNSTGNTNGSKYIAAISETDGKISATAVDVATTYSATGTTAISGTGVAAALGTLDVNAVGVAATTGNRYISQISETDGKINAILATASLGSSTQPIWIDNGTIKATSYSLSATINASGNANKIAYYSGTNAISAGSITTDGNYIEFSNGDYGIQRIGRSKQWRQGRDGALVKITSLPSTAYSPILSAKTTNGSWEIGTYDNASYTDDLIFTYITDENYNNSNTRTAQIKFSEDSYISGNGFKITNVVSNDNQSYGNLSIEVLGTTSTTGISTLELGNNIASGSNKNAQGKIHIYSTNTNGMSITTASLSASRTAILPDTSGWIAIGGNGSTTGVAGADQIMYLSTSGVLTAGTSATNENTVNTIVKRDSSGNFLAGTITATTFTGKLNKKLDLKYDGTESTTNVSFNNSADVTFSLAGFVRGVDDSTIVTPSGSYLPLTGGTMTGSLIANASTSTRQVRNITYSTSAPTSSDGSVGDIWIVYTA